MNTFSMEHTVILQVLAFQMKQLQMRFFISYLLK